MRFLRAFFIALFTALVGCVLSFFVADYLTKLLHVPEMEGQRGMTIIFLGAPLGILAGLIIGIASAILVRRQGFFGFLFAQGWSLLVVCSLAGLLLGVPYLLSDKPPRIDGKQLELQFELRAPSTVKIPDQPNGYSIRASLYLDNRQSEFAFITGAPSQKMPNRSQSRDVLPYSRIARADRSSHRSVMRRKRRSSSS